MIIKFETMKMLELDEEIQESGKLWLNIHKNEVESDEYDVIFKNDKTKFNDHGYLDPNFLDREMVDELFYMIRNGDKIVMINNVVGSTMVKKSESFDVEELNKIVGDKDFKISITASVVKWDGYLDFTEKEYMEFEVDENGINIKLVLNKFIDDKPDMISMIK